MQGRGRTCSRTELLRGGLADEPGCGDERGGRVGELPAEKAGAGARVIATMRGQGYAMAASTAGVKKPVGSVRPVAMMPAMWGVANA